MSKNLVEVRGLKKYFPLGEGNVLKAVDDVSFAIREGETFGLVGESGCGKTTVSLVLMAALRIDVPTIFLTGGPMLTGHLKGDRPVCYIDLVDCQGELQRGIISQEKMDEIWVIARREERLLELQSKCRNRKVNRKEKRFFSPNFRSIKREYSRCSVLHFCA